MASLRKPSQAIPSRLAQSVPRPRDPLPGDSARKRDARKSKVEEKMKSRRMSIMRYAPESYSVGAGAHGVDFLSSDPYQYTLDVAPPLEVDEYGETRPPPPLQSSSRGAYSSPKAALGTRELQSLDEDGEDDDHESVHDEAIGTRAATEAHQEWDFTELKGKDVDVSAYVRKIMTGADEEEKARLVKALNKQKEANARDLQKTVTEQYAEFVTISKEISTLENEMLELKELLTEWKTVPQLMGKEDTLAPTLDKDGNVERHRARRNSPLDLQQMYKAQITNLWSTVEGSQRYLPLTQGRHLVFETHNFIELNAATYKPKQNISLFLLNDLLLVAGRRRLKTGQSTAGESEQGRLVAERCFVLTDLVITDIKDSGDLTSALKIKRGKEVLLYRTPKPEDKKQLLQAFRTVAQDLAEKRRKENEAEQERRRTMYQGEHGAAARMTRMSLFMEARPLSTIGTSVSDTKDLLWIDEFADDLTMAIATRDWDEGVNLAERGHGLMRTVANNPEASEMLKFRMESLEPKLVEQIAKDLGSPDIRKTSAARLIELLVKLERADLARDTFLKARHEFMLKLVRAIKHEGDVAMYIHELAVVCFTIIRHTSDWYMNAFKENRMASAGFVTWAKKQIEYFSDVFRRQVYAPAIEQNVVDDCLRVTASANRKLLRDVGLDFTFLLNSLTERDPAAAARPTPQSAQAPRGFRPDVSSFDTPPPSAGREPPPSPGDLSQGSTAPLFISRRSRPSDGGAPPPSNGLRNVSNVSAISNASDMSAGSGASTPVPRPPPRSERRSRPPPPRPV
ncbi:exocyst complex component exo84 [Vanrija albida]|uniref:Exocyst complex component EXO84 n=1 Tax=Vanrija albida TaxID=181172 RepID=A0ABR3PYW5_9TREE